MSHTLDWIHHTKRHTLSNGLTFLTHPLPHSEAVGLHFTVQAGYFCETDAEVGLAHLLEHMYFKGSGRYPEPGTLGITMKALGGMINASTSYDQTTYYCEVPAENLTAALEIMADAFVAPLFPADELQRETEVVIEEFNRKIDSPAAYSQEQLIQLAFTRHRMRRWRIGTPEQLRSFRREHLFDYFHRYYQPQNIIVTVAGKFDQDRLQGDVERLFAPMRSGDLKKDFGPAEPQQTELRYSHLKGEATQSYLHLAFHVPGVIHPDGPALEFLTFLLSQGRSARLHRHVVEQRRSAHSASCSYAAYEDVGLLLLSAVTEARNLSSAGNDVWFVLQDILKNGVSAAEIKKVKDKLLLHQVMQTEDALSLAQLLGFYESYGGYLRMKEYLDAMQEVEEDSIVETARKYLRPDNLSVLEFANEVVEAVTAPVYRSRLESAYPSPEMSLPAPMILREENRTGSPKSVGDPIVHRGRVTYILHPDAQYPYVAAGIFFRGGRNEESDENAGITGLMLRTLLKGTSRFTAEQLAFRFDAMGNPPRMSSSRDFCGFAFETLPASFAETWDLLLHCIRDARFPGKEVDTEKAKMISIIRRTLDDNFTRPFQLFQRAFYGNHPYALPEAGFEESVQKFSVPDLMGQKERIFAADRAFVSIVGSFDPERLIPYLDQTLAQLPTDGPGFVPPASVFAPAEAEHLEVRMKKQTAFVLGFPAPRATDPEIHKYEVLHQVLSGMGGRLFLNLRSRKSLAYTVYATTAASLYSGTFLTYIAGDAAKEEAALTGMWEELEAMKDTTVSPQELENAKNSLIGNYVLNTQTSSSRLLDYVSSHLLDRPIPFIPYYRDRIRAVTAEDVREVARKTFQRQNSTIGIVRGTTNPTEAEKLVKAR